MPKRLLHLLLFLCLVTRGMAQEDTAYSPDTKMHSPFKALPILRATAIGHKESGTVDVAMVLANQSYKNASLIFSINPSLSKASDDLDSLYSISQIRFGTYKKDSAMDMTVNLRPNEMLHCGLYINNVPLNAQYIRKLIIMTSLSLDNENVGQENILLQDIKITWR
jgi:hypothetical protein